MSGRGERKIYELVRFFFSRLFPVAIVGQKMVQEWWVCIGEFGSESTRAREGLGQTGPPKFS